MMLASYLHLALCKNTVVAGTFVSCALNLFLFELACPKWSDPKLQPLLQQGHLQRAFKIRYCNLSNHCHLQAIWHKSTNTLVDFDTEEMQKGKREWWTIFYLLTDLLQMNRIGSSPNAHCKTLPAVQMHTP